MNDPHMNQHQFKPFMPAALVLDRAAAEALGYRCMGAAEYEAQRDAELQAQLEGWGLL